MNTEKKIYKPVLGRPLRKQEYQERSTYERERERESERTRADEHLVCLHRVMKKSYEKRKKEIYIIVISPQICSKFLKLHWVLEKLWRKHAATILQNKKSLFKAA